MNAPLVEPYALHDRVTVHLADVLDATAALGAGSFHCIATSPPFWGVRDYGLAPTLWPEITYVPMTGAAAITVPASSSPLGLEPTLEAFVAHTIHVFRALWRVLRDDGVAWVEYGDGYDCGTNASRGASSAGGNPRAEGRAAHKVSGWTNRCAPTRRTAGLKPKDLLGVPWRVALALQADGWYLRGDHPWLRPNPMPESITDRPTRAHSFVFLFSKRERYFFDAVAIAEQVRHPKSSQPEDMERAFSRRRATAPVARQGVYRSGNRRRRYGGDRDVPSGSARAHNAASIPWEDKSGLKNARSVFIIPTQPYPGAHFATWPEKLAEKLVLSGTSGFGACAACGAQWVRRRDVALVRVTCPAGLGVRRSAWPSLARKGRKLLRLLTAPVVEGVAAWRPDCACGASAVRARVLDPFGGSGTTGLVGARLGREVVLIEAQAKYLPLMERRLAKINASAPRRSGPAPQHVEQLPLRGIP